MAMLKWVFGHMSIIRPRETCKLHGSEVLWFVDTSPAGPLYSWCLHWVWSGGHCCQALSSGFPTSGRWGWLQMHGGRSRVLVHRSACITELISHVSNSGFSFLCPKRDLFQGGLLPLILFWREAFQERYWYLDNQMSLTQSQPFYP